LHHSGEVTSDYRGTDTIIALTDYQLRKKKWSQLGWHYAIAPDGAIWLGVPLDQPAAQLVRGHKDKTVSVLLLMDGDKELPSANQPRALGRLLGALCKRSDITPELTFDSRHGFHHDYDPRTSCPGAQLTKDLVISWIRESRGGA